MLPTSPSPQQSQHTLKNIGINSDEVHILESTGVVASLVNWLSQDSALSQLLISWFGDSGTKAVVNFVDQVRDGHGADASRPLSFVTGSGDTIKMWDSLSSDGEKRELNYSMNGTSTITLPGCVALLCVELAQAARKAVNEADFNATDRELFEKINLNGFTFTGSELQGADLSGLSLRGAYFSYCNLENVNMMGCDLQDVEFICAQMNEQTKLDHSNIQATKFDLCSFNGASMIDVFGKALSMKKLISFSEPSSKEQIDTRNRNFHVYLAASSGTFKCKYYPTVPTAASGKT